MRLKGMALGLVGIVGMHCLSVVEATAFTEYLSSSWVHSPADIGRVLTRYGSLGEEKTGPQFWAAACQSHLYGMTELPVQYFACGWNSQGQSIPVEFALQLETTGRELINDRLCGGEFRVARWWGTGLVWQRHRIRIANETEPIQESFAVHASFQQKTGKGVFSHWEFYLPLYNNRAAASDQIVRQRVLSWNVGHGSESMAFALDQGREGAPQLTVELLAGLGHETGFMLHVEPATGLVGPGIFVARHSFLLMTSHLVHPILGTTQRVMIVMGAWSGCHI